MDIKLINDKSVWESFVIGNDNTFLHSFSWGEFNRSLGNKIWRFGVYKNNTLIAVYLVIKIKAKRGSFLFVPHGPIIDKRQKDHEVIRILKETKKQLTALCIEEKCAFFRIAPILANTPENVGFFRSLGFKKAPMHMHSEICWLLDLSCSETDLLKKMRKTTRYLINQKNKYSINVYFSKENKDFDKFYDIYKKTEQRQKFIGFSRKYLKTEFEAFAAEDKAIFFFAEHDSKVVSTALIIAYGSMGYYHHGASNLSDPKIPGAYVIQWEIIRYLKQAGFDFYNFWGIAPEQKPSHPWQGLSQFKKGFGGYELEYVSTQDFVLNKFYWINWVIETFRKFRRGY